MARCQKIRKRKRQYCSGDLRDPINIQERSITAPGSGVDFTEEFDKDRMIMSAINTVSGKTFFDGVGTETPITHKVGFRFDSSVTNQSWILLEDGRRFDILSLEDLDERHLWMEATCVDRGNQVASQI